MSVRASLRRAALGRGLMCLQHRVEAGVTTAFVLEVGAQFVLMLRIEEGGAYDGFACWRIDDVRLVEPDHNAAFWRAVLRQRGERRPRRPRLDLSSTAGLLRSAGRAFPLVTIQHDDLWPDECQVGAVVAVSDAEVDLWCISPQARWDRAPTAFALRDITRVEGGGRYAAALALVAAAATSRKPARARLH